jgi:transcriptional regulator of acetoin/glycerol metabolism
VIAATLNRTRGNVKEAAAALGIDRSTLYDRMKRYGMNRVTV